MKTASQIELAIYFLEEDMNKAAERIEDCRKRVEQKAINEDNSFIVRNMHVYVSELEDAIREYEVKKTAYEYFRRGLSYAGIDPDSICGGKEQ